MDSIIWTGNNIDAVEKFALNNYFGFTVGSTYGRIRWYHKLFERLSCPREDKTVLEIFPEKKDEDKPLLDRFINSHTDDELHELYNAVRTTSMVGIGVLETLRQLVLAVIDERNREYESWHWTTANPGDRIFADGTVERG